MQQEITLVSQLLAQLKKKYELSACAQCLAMQDYLESEYKHLKLKLQSLKSLTQNNNLSLEHEIARAQKEAQIIGMYVMV